LRPKSGAYPQCPPLPSPPSVARHPSGPPTSDAPPGILGKSPLADRAVLAFHPARDRSGGHTGDVPHFGRQAYGARACRCLRMGNALATFDAARRPSPTTLPSPPLVARVRSLPSSRTTPHRPSRASSCWACRMAASPRNSRHPRDGSSAASVLRQPSALPPSTRHVSRHRVRRPARRDRGSKGLDLWGFLVLTLVESCQLSPGRRWTDGAVSFGG
jgi:hypothetical protein